MGDRSSDGMNLDLNLGPVPEQDPGSGSITSELVNLEDLIGAPARRIRQALRLRARQERMRWRQVHAPPQPRNMTMELNHLMANPENGGSVQAGEGSVTAEERIVEVPKACENNGFLEDDDSNKKVDAEKGCGKNNDGSFFDCNICLDLAREPVVTCCGHLFCWPCLYRWLHVHSDAKECPVCKGEVTVKNVTPIYGRGSSAHEPEEDPSLQIPVRPHAKRVESWRQTVQRTALSFPVEEMIRRLGSRFDLSPDLIPQQDTDHIRETPERTNAIIARILTSRGLRREQQNSEIVDLTGTGDGTTSPDVWERETRRIQSIMLRRSQQPQRTATFSSLGLNSAEAGFLRQHNAVPVDDRDSFSSIAAGINSESQTMDTTMEIDSMVSISTSSRRRNDASRASDVDSGDSRAPRRRRLH